MKHFFTLSTLMCIFFIFPGCNKDEVKQSKYFIDAKVSNGNDFNTEIDSVKAIVRNASTSWVIGRAKFENGSFSMNLDPIDPKELRPVKEAYSNLDISDETAKIFGGLNLIALNNGVKVGTFSYHPDYDENSNKPINRTSYTYSDKDVKITGSLTGMDGGKDGVVMEFRSKYNLSFKKGWNKVEYKYTIQTATLQETEDNCPADFKGYTWHYYPNTDPY